MSFYPFLKGSLVPLILHLLKEEGELYGYEMTRLVKERTSNGMTLTEAALYPALHQLEKDGLVTVRRAQVGGRQRKYYKLTSKGSLKGKNQVEELMESMKTMMNLLTTPVKS